MTNAAALPNLEDLPTRRRELAKRGGLDPWFASPQTSPIVNYLSNPRYR